MRPEVWRPPVEPSPAERAVIKAVRRAKLLVFLREHRHELFDEQFQAELAGAYVDSAKGQPPVPPARLALATALPSGCPGVPIAASKTGPCGPQSCSAIQPSAKVIAYSHRECGDHSCHAASRQRGGDG